MVLTVYKGFSIEFFGKIEGTPLLDNDITSKLNVLAFDKKYRKKLDIPKFTTISWCYPLTWSLSTIVFTI